jgi:glycosyltransferase involved in cell wall biosynthesis
MKVLYDHQTFESQNIGGISRYFFELIRHFNKDKTIDWELPIKYSNNLYLKSLPAFAENLLPIPPKPDPLADFFWGLQFKGKGTLFELKKKLFPQPVIGQEPFINKNLSVQKIIEGNFDIFHPTYYDNYFLDFIGSKPFVLTVYDLIHQIFPENFFNAPVDKNKEIIQRANKILAISESTKRDLVTIYGVDESKVVVTHLANSLNNEALENLTQFHGQLPKDYLLFVGNREGYKNFYFFAQAFAMIAEIEKNICIVCTGQAFKDYELNFFDKLNIRDRVLHFYVDDAKLVHLYKNAIAFVFPSMYEGFGLPVLEAFSCDCPVLVSNSSSLSEIGEDAVIYFEPKNISSLKQAIEKVLYAKEIRESLIKKGHLQLQKFSWQKTADATKQVYRDILTG